MEKQLLKFEFNVVDIASGKSLSKPTVYADSYIDAVNYAQHWTGSGIEVQLSSSGYNDWLLA